MQKLDMYYLAQMYSYNNNDYKVPVGKSHLVRPISGRLSLTLCGMPVGTMNLPRADIELKQWLINLTTCKKCRKIVEKSIK